MRARIVEMLNMEDVESAGFERRYVLRFERKIAKYTLEHAERPRCATTSTLPRRSAEIASANGRRCSRLVGEALALRRPEAHRIVPAAGKPGRNR